MNRAIVLASWNLFQGLLHTKSRVRPKPKPEHLQLNTGIAQKLADLDADVLVLPEAWRFRTPGAQWAEELADELGYELHQSVADRPSRTHEVVPWRMVVLTRIPVTRLDDHHMPAFGGLGARTYVRLAFTDSDLRFGGGHPLGVHLLLQRHPVAWVQELRQLRELARSCDIIAGDMNLWGPLVRAATPGMRLAVTGRTFPARRPHSQIDHVLVNDRVEVMSGEVMAPMGSDHLAVRVVVRAAPADHLG